MGGQEFNTVDVVRLEVETDPTGLVNLVQNPSGELGGWGWITTLSNSAMSGIAGPLLQYERTVAGASSFTTEALPIAAGEYAAARWEAVAAAGAAYVRARFEWLDSAGALLSSSAQSAYFSTTTTVGTAAPVVAPASTAFVRLRFDLYSDNTGTNPTGTHWLKLHEVTVATASTSGDLGETRVNLVSNPSFEVDAAGWHSPLTDNIIARSTAVGGQSGSAAMSITTGAASRVMRVRCMNPIPVTAGKTYTFSAYHRRGTTPALFWAVSMTWYNGATSLGVVTGNPIVPTTTGWTRSIVTGTAPATATHAVVNTDSYTNATAAGQTAYVDAALFEVADSAGAYFDGSTPSADGWDYSWNGTAHNSPSTAFNPSLTYYIPPVEYFDILGDSHEIRVTREQLNVGTLSATVLSRTLDPSQSDLLRPGRRARLSTLVDGVWETIIGGKLLEADVTYALKNPTVPTEKQARIEVVLIDPTQAVANAGRPEGVATIDELPFVLEGAGVPWNVNGSGNQVPTANVTTNNEGAKALDQVALTRDTVIGYAWMSRVGVLNAWDRDQIASGSPVLLDEDDYSELDLSFSTKDAINEVQITVQSLGADGTTTENVYGPFTDDASIGQWGRYRKEFTVTGLDSAAVEDLAAAILDAAATPRIRVNSLTIPLKDLDRVETHALRDLYDEVQVVLSDLGVDQVLRVTGLEHTITTEKWMLRLDFSDEGGVAVPTVQPPVQSGIRPDVGVIELFAGTTPPAGKLLCDGASYAVADYPYLHAVIGYTFGGAGASFNVPNLTDKFPIGSGTKALGTSGGSSVATLTAANLPAHTHQIQRSAAANTGGGTRVALGDTSTAANGVTEANTGTATPFSVLNPWLSLNFVIRAA